MNAKMFSSGLLAAASLCLAAAGCSTEPRPQYDVEVEADDLYVQYYGDVRGFGNFYIGVTTEGFDDTQFARPDNQCFIVDLYHDVVGGDTGKEVALPEGIFPLVSDYPAWGVISDVYTKYIVTDSLGNEVSRTYFVSGEMRVGRKGDIYDVELLFMDKDSTTYHCTYSGKCDLDDWSEYRSAPRRDAVRRALR